MHHSFHPTAFFILFIYYLSGSDTPVAIQKLTYLLQNNVKDQEWRRPHESQTLKALYLFYFHIIQRSSLWGLSGVEC